MRLTRALKAAGPGAPLLVGLAIGESVSDQAHRRRCSRQELLAALKAAVARVVEMAKRRLCEVGDE
jgi:hypothetical protein